MDPTGGVREHRSSSDRCTQVALALELGVYG
jgi:hypothetical protein